MPWVGKEVFGWRGISRGGLEGRGTGHWGRDALCMVKTGTDGPVENDVAGGGNMW